MEMHDKVYKIIGAAMEVHRILRCGYKENVYQEALAIEFQIRGIPYIREVHIPLSYKDYPLKHHYQADFVCYDNVMLELKALREMGTREEAQILGYLRATGMKKGILINFGEESLRYQTYVM